MLNKIVDSALAALADVRDGATILVSGFGGAGVPEELVDALMEQGARELTIVNNNAGNGEVGIAALFKAGRIRKLICSYPRQVDSHHFQTAYRAGKVELEIVPQGTLSERMRAAGAGIGAFYTPTGYGTELARGKESRVIDGKGHVLEHPLHGDFALVKAERGDRWGNLVYRKSARNYGPTMASAAKVTIAQVYETVELGKLDPEVIVTPGIYVTRLVKVPRRTAAYRAPAGGSVTRGISGRSAA
jgi:3-oxoadipate CoA-transferase alpha subunit